MPNYSGEHLAVIKVVGVGGGGTNAVNRMVEVTTTINSSLQKAIYEQYKNDKSAHVALNPSTGEVKALVSTPSYDAQAFILVSAPVARAIS